MNVHTISYEPVFTLGGDPCWPNERLTPDIESKESQQFPWREVPEAQRFQNRYGVWGISCLCPEETVERFLRLFTRFAIVP